MARRERHDGKLEHPREVELLASPIRQEIVDTLEALGGEAPVAAIAAQLGRPADGLYYHLRLLAAGGLLDELPTDGDGRRYRTRSGGARLRLRYRPGATANARAVARVAAGMLRIAGRDFGAALGDPAVAVEGPRRALWASRTKGWVGAAELEEINRLLLRLGELLRRPRAPRRDRLLSLTWVLAPVAARPARRAAAPRRGRRSI
ncbi:hypothetical protein MBSD_n2520 [Mizugakiibacter sediminis]|uniref:HTH arsR-type domain-containing protein n=2 Tax=Mizugakiibacter sediminis TaxID=1475481 RepID=A0A0K8QQN5_9GAMM|nr:helix-turn-helix domain-containing protein [Mizugakiibacter sediminis]GAP67204.1 hypothetical protein MBSD_n2520 [Mizugakiibacter sediminis]